MTPQGIEPLFADYHDDSAIFGAWDCVLPFATEILADHFAEMRTVVERSLRLQERFFVVSRVGSLVHGPSPNRLSAIQFSLASQSMLLC